MKYTTTERPRKFGRTAASQLVPAAVGDHFRYTGENPSSSQLVKQTRMAIERSTAKGDRERLPLTTEMLFKMVSVMENTPIGIRNMFMVILMTFAFLRESEVVMLKDEDVKKVQKMVDST